MGIANSKRYAIRVVSVANDFDRKRFNEFLRNEIRESTVEVTNFPWSDCSLLLADISAILIHSLPNRTLSRKLIREKIWLSRPTVHFVHSFSGTAAEQIKWATFWGQWHGWPPCRLIAPSEATAARVRALQKHVEGFGGEMPDVVVVAPAVDVTACASGDRFAGRQRLSCTTASKVVLCIARLTPEKLDHAQLIDAFAALTPRFHAGHDARLVFAGGVAPSDTEYVKDLRARGQMRGISLTIYEHVSDRDKLDLLAAADVFVSPASHPQESFGLAIVEAMAAGLPIVATNWNGYKEVLPPAYRPYLVPTIADRLAARNLEDSRLCEACAVDFWSLVDRLELFLRDPELRGLLAEEGKRRAQFFTREEFTGKVLMLLDELILEHQAGPKAKPPHTEVPDLRSPIDYMASTYLHENSILDLSATFAGSAGSVSALVAKALEQSERKTLSSLTSLFDGDILLRNLAILSLLRSGYLRIKDASVLPASACLPTF
ncbi:MAG: glycosyltransferase [Terracidiphilus sp.]